MYTQVAGAALAALLFAPAVAQESPPSTGRWIDSIEWSGDVRFRYEAIDEQGEEDRSRFRFRGRFGFSSDLNDKLGFSARIATSDGSPVSTNLTFDDGFSAKDIRIDRAYFDWQASDSLNVRFGKFGAPWTRAGSNSLLWDSDLNPEGIAVFFRDGKLFGNASAFQIEERSSGDDSWLFSAQGGISLNPSEDTRLRAMAAYYGYTNTAGNEPFYDGSAKGNTVDAGGNLVNDYEIVELSADYRIALGGWDTTFFGVWAQNTSARQDETAHAFGVRLGGVDGPGTAQFSYAWQDTEADAVIGTFSDSDFAGGETDASGHFLKAGYGIAENIELGATLIVAEIEESSGAPRDYNRIMLDIEFLFE